MKLKDIIIAFIALIIAVFLFRILWSITFFVIQIVVILIVAYVVYLFLKKVLWKQARNDQSENLLSSIRCTPKITIQKIIAPCNAPSQSISRICRRYFNIIKIMKYITDAAEAVKKGLFLSIFSVRIIRYLGYYKKNLSMSRASTA